MCFASAAWDGELDLELSLGFAGGERGGDPTTVADEAFNPASGKQRTSLTWSCRMMMMMMMRRSPATPTGASAPGLRRLRPRRRSAARPDATYLMTTTLGSPAAGARGTCSRWARSESAAAEDTCPGQGRAAPIIGCRRTPPGPGSPTTTLWLQHHQDSHWGSSSWAAAAGPRFQAQHLNPLPIDVRPRYLPKWQFATSCRGLKILVLARINRHSSRPPRRPASGIQDPFLPRAPTVKPAIEQRWIIEFC